MDIEPSVIENKHLIFFLVSQYLLPVDLIYTRQICKVWHFYSSQDVLWKVFLPDADKFNYSRYITSEIDYSE